MNSEESKEVVIPTGGEGTKVEPIPVAPVATEQVKDVVVQAPEVVQPVPVVQPVQTPVTVQQVQPALQQSVEPQQVEEEKEQEINTTVPQVQAPVANEPPQKGGKLKIFFIILLFALLIGVALFLPQITQFLDDMKAGNRVKEIKSGTLVCNYKNESQTGTKEIEAKFIYKDERLEKAELSFITENEEDKRMETVMERCETLESEVLDINGISIKCSQSEGKIVQLEKIDYSAFDSSKLTAAFSEAGGYYPIFDYNEKIDKVQKEMVKAEYSCIRQE